MDKVGHIVKEIKQWISILFKRHPMIVKLVEQHTFISVFWWLCFSNMEKNQTKRVGVSKLLTGGVPCNFQPHHIKILTTFPSVNFSSKPHHLQPVETHSMSISSGGLIQATKPCYFNYSPALYSSIGVRSVITCIVSEFNFRREVKHAKLVKSNLQISLIRLHYGWALGWFK